MNSETSTAFSTIAPYSNQKNHLDPYLLYFLKPSSNFGKEFSFFFFKPFDIRSSSAQVEPRLGYECQKWYLPLNRSIDLF